MKCPYCKREVNLKKYEYGACWCGRTLMMIEIKSVKQLVDVTKDKEDEK